LTQEIARNDELTVFLLGALQIHPRVSWTDLATVLGVNATTLSRRWQILQEEGLAWVTCIPADDDDWFYLAPHGATAYVEVSCRPGARNNVIAQIATDREAWSIECTSGTRDLLLSVTAATTRALDDYTTNVLGAIDGIVSVRTNPVRRFLASPSGWRISGLRAGQRSTLMAMAKLAERPLRHHEPTELERHVMAELSIDGRATATEISRATGFSVSAVNGAVGRIASAPWAQFRVDFAQEQLGWDVMASLWITAPQSQVPEIGNMLRRFPAEVREAVSMIGGANLYVHIWAKDFDTLDSIEEMITGSFPLVRLADRWITTRFAKRAGAILGSDGRRESFVPMLPPLGAARVTAGSPGAPISTSPGKDSL